MCESGVENKIMKWAKIKVLGGLKCKKKVDEVDLREVGCRKQNNEIAKNKLREKVGLR